MSHATAADTATRYSDVIRASMARMAKQSPYVGQLAAQQVALALGEVPPPITEGLTPGDQRPEFLRETHYVVQDEVVRRLWARHRIVYDFDADLWAALGDTDPDTVIPGGLLSRLPHPDPFVRLPEPLLLPVDERHRMRVEGFFVVGRVPQTVPGIAGQQAAQVILQGSTHDPDAAGDLGLLIGGDVETYEGRPQMAWPGVQDMVWSRVTLDVAGHDVRVGDLIDSIASRFDTADYTSIGAPQAGGFDNTVAPVIGRAVSALVYLCATNAELRPLPARTAARQARRAGASKPPKVVQVGHLTGAALRAWRRSAPADDTTPGTGRRSMRPHVRRAHFHTFRVGPGRTESVVKWLAPIPINATGTDAERPTVVSIAKGTPA